MLTPWSCLLLQHLFPIFFSFDFQVFSSCKIIFLSSTYTFYCCVHHHINKTINWLDDKTETFADLNNNFWLFFTPNFTNITFHFVLLSIKLTFSIFTKIVRTKTDIHFFHSPFSIFNTHRFLRDMHTHKGLSNEYIMVLDCDKHVHGK